MGVFQMYGKKRLYLIFLFVLSILMVGCSSETATSEKTKESNTNEDEKYGGELNVGYHLHPPSLDPHMTTDVGVRDIAAHIFEGLVTVDSSLEVQPMLAESFEIDGGTITFKIRQGIKFHNGEEMKASDVISSLERWTGLSTQAKNYLSEATFEEVDDYTVVVNNPNPTVLDIHILADLTQFAGIMPKDIIEKAGSEEVDEYIGTGPYKFGEFKANQYVHLTRYEDYQSRSEPADALAGEKKAYMDDIYFHFVADASTRVSGLQSGEYDIATQIPHDNGESLENNPDINISITSNSWLDLVFNKKGIFKDNKNRQAVNAAIDVDALLFASYGNEKYYVKDHALVTEEQTSWYTDVGSEEHNTYDPELAKKLLEETGYNGEEIKILASRERSNEYDMAVVAQEQLSAIGMNAKLVESDWGTFLERLNDENAWDFYFGSFTFRPVPSQYLFWNPEWFGWTDSAEAEEINKNILQSSPDEASQYTDQLHQVFWDYLPVIKIGNGTVISGARADIEGYHYQDGPILWNVSKSE